MSDDLDDVNGDISDSTFADDCEIENAAADEKRAQDEKKAQKEEMARRRRFAALMEQEAREKCYSASELTEMS